MKLGQLVAQLPVSPDYDHASTDIASLEYDSRLVRPGGLFVALRGGYADGHAFATQAVERGAAALLVEEQLPIPVPQVVVPNTRQALATVAAAFYSHPSEELVAIGITGTDGKTTTSYILDHILRTVGHTTGMIGTVSVRIANETIDHETRQTTPESADIQRLLRQMVDANVTHAILEATSHGLDLHRLDHVQFRVGVVTNITHEHLEHHKTIENYWAAKALLFREVARNNGNAIVNLDDPGARSVLPAAAGCERIWTYSVLDSQADIFGTVDRSDLRGSAGEVVISGARHRFEVPLIGEFNVANSLASLGASCALGLDISDALAALATTPHIPGRMTVVDAGQPFGVIVDYAHTPQSLAKVLSLLRRQRPEGRLVAVFGSAGERDTAKRPIQGQVSAELADITIVTNEDPRYEDADEIVQAIAAGAKAAGAIAGESLFTIVERRDAIAHAFDLARPCDTILLAGKGHERSIIWNGTKLPWDETAIALDLLAERGWRQQ